MEFLQASQFLPPRLQVTGNLLELPLIAMHNLIVTMATNIDKTIITLVPEVIPLIGKTIRIMIINLPLVFARSKTIMLMIVNFCDLALVLVPQAVLAIFMVTMMTGMQPMFIPNNMAKLNDPLHPNNNKNMIKQTILNPD